MTKDEKAKAKVMGEAEALTNKILAILNDSYLKDLEQEINCHVLALIDALIAVLGSGQLRFFHRRQRAEKRCLPAGTLSVAILAGFLWVLSQS